MCKNTFLIGITNPENAIEFLQVIAPLMSKYNSDGIGYAGINNEGLFVERFLKNENIFTTGVYDQVDIELANSLSGMVDHEMIKRQNETYAKNKTIQGNCDLLTATTILLHTRKSTNKVCLENVHPFVIQDTALVHNGIITNHEDFLKEISSCDSEAILQQYLNHEINDYPEKISDVTETLEGYYACGVVTKNNDGLFVADVFKSKDANLYVTTIPEIGGYCFSTSKEDIHEALKLLGWGFQVAIFPVLPCIYSRFNAITGELINQSMFKEKSREYVAPVVINKQKSNRTRQSYRQPYREESYTDVLEQDLGNGLDLGVMYDIYSGLPEDLKKQCDAIMDNEEWSNAVWLRRYQSTNYAA